MDATQLQLDLWKRDRDLDSLSGNLAGCGLLAADVDFLRAIAEADKSREHESYVCKTLRDWQLACGHDKNTARKSMDRLAKTGALAYEKTTEGFAVLVDWRAIWNLTPREPVRARLRNEIGAAGEGLVRAGETSYTCSSKQESKALVPCSVPACDRVLGGVVRAGEGPAVRRSPLLPPRPWATRGGLASEDLVRAVRDRHRDLLTGLYWAGVEAAFWQDCEHFHQTFLACCWQAVQDATTSPMGLLSEMVRVHLSGKPPKRDGVRYTIRGESDDWASATRREWRRREATAGLDLDGDEAWRDTSTASRSSNAATAGIRATC